MMTTPQQKLVAITPGGEITDDMIAGHYILYSIREQPVALAKVHKAFNDHGLDVSRLPKQRRPEHVMQDACTKAQKIHVNGKRTEVRAQQVGRDGNFLIYQMTRHVHDLQNRVIEHPKALRVLFSFEDSTLSFEPLEGATEEDVQPLIDEIRGYYEANQELLPGRGLRTIMRKYIEAAGAEFIRDGAYFLPRSTRLTQNNKLRAHHGEQIESAQFIEALHATLRAIYDDEPEFHSIPCVNDEGQRAFLKRRFIENCTESLKSYRDQCLELVKSGEGTQRQQRLRDRIIAERHEIDERRKQFAEILGDTLEELDRDMQLADAALSKFLSEAE